MKAWTKILVLLALALAMTIGASALMVACGDDDDDNDTAGDDTAGDDDDDNDNDDDNGYDPDTCEGLYSIMYYTCNLAFQDELGAEIALEDVIAWCEQGGTDYDLGNELANCIYSNQDNCDAMLECINGVIGG